MPFENKMMALVIKLYSLYDSFLQWCVNATASDAPH